MPIVPWKRRHDLLSSTCVPAINVRVSRDMDSDITRMNIPVMDILSCVYHQGTARRKNTKLFVFTSF